MSSEEIDRYIDDMSMRDLETEPCFYLNLINNALWELCRQLSIIREMYKDSLR